MNNELCGYGKRRGICLIDLIDPDKAQLGFRN